MALARAAGLVPETAERLQYHVHSHLDVYVDGQSVVVPAGLGIEITDPAVHTFDVDGEKQYGGINPPCAKPCISPLHTHDVSGTLHTESATRKNNTLGQLFTEWGVKLDPNCVATYCAPDHADRHLRQRQEIHRGSPDDRADQFRGDRRGGRVATGQDPRFLESGGPMRGFPSGAPFARESPVHLSSQED